MYITAAYILEIYSGKSFSSFAYERIFSPLQMHGTFMSRNLAMQSGNLSQSWSETGRRIPFWFSESIMHTNSGAGGILSTARDMVWI